MRHGFLKHGLRALAGLGLMLLSSAAFALGLGEIRVLSQPGQPLVAEIPIISNEPGELEQLQARLASPETFQRVGLERPEGLVSGLDFAIALGDDGRPVIRVTSREPVQVASLNFLIEVDWGQGRLVREYSALVSTPGALVAAGEPAIEAPLPPPSSTIIREPDPLASVPVEPGPTPTPAVSPTATAEPAATPESAPPVAAASAPVPSAADLRAATGDIAVRSGQTLSQIARDLGQGGLDQTMIALLRANPEAFIRGNINLLKAGAVLRVPPASELAQLQASEATALVREQNAQWRQARQPIPQPVDAAPSATAPAPAGTAGAAPQVAQARLEIAPPAADAAARAGTQSGTDAEGEGNMLANQTSTATQEDLAARESEVQELRAQVAELENLKQQQAQLIAMKDTELAAAQQALAQNQGNAGQPLWLWAGVGLLVLGLVVAWLLSRRRPAVVSTPRAGYDTAAMAAAVPAGAYAASDTATEVEEAVRSDAYYDSDIPATLPEPEFVPEPEPTRTAPVAAAVVPPAWTPPTVKPTWHTSDTGAGVAALNSAPAGRERLELAIAYMDLGDVETARDLLNEVVAGGDSGARDEASQLLRELG